MHLFIFWSVEIFVAFYKNFFITRKRFETNFLLSFSLRQSEEMARPAVARARRPVDRTPPLWRKRGWVGPAAAWIPDRVARARIGAQLTGGVVSCIAAAATVPAWSGSGYRLTATPCDPARRWTTTTRRTPIRIWWTATRVATRTMNRPDRHRVADRRPRLIPSVGSLTFN